MNKKWYLVCTKPGRYKKVSAQLTKKKIENYYPLNRIVKIERNRARISFEPLFPSFVFVYISEAEITTIRNIDPVINFMYWLENPAVFKEDEIETMRSFTTKFSKITQRKMKVDSNERAEAKREYQNDLNNNDKTNPIIKDTYKLLLPSLGYTMISEKQRSTNDIFKFDYEKIKIAL
jgi:transcription antitermination factor NusG